MQEPVWVGPFLESLRDHGVKSRAARLAGVSPSTPDSRAERDADFKAAMEAAVAEADEALEIELRARVRDGTPRVLTHQGVVSYEPERGPDGYPLLHEDGRVKLLLDEHGKPVPVRVAEKSDALLIAALRARSERQAAVLGSGSLTVSWLTEPVAPATIPTP